MQAAIEGKITPARQDPNAGHERLRPVTALGAHALENKTAYILQLERGLLLPKAESPGRMDEKTAQERM